MSYYTKGNESQTPKLTDSPYETFVNELQVTLESVVEEMEHVLPDELFSQTGRIRRFAAATDTLDKHNNRLYQPIQDILMTIEEGYVLNQKNLNIDRDNSKDIRILNRSCKKSENKKKAQSRDNRRQGGVWNIHCGGKHRRKRNPARNNRKYQNSSKSLKMQ